MLGQAKCELGDGTTDTSLDPLSPESHLVVTFALAPLFRAIRVADRHADDRDRRVHTAERHHARNAPTGPDDHLPADLLPQDAVRRADVVAALRCDRRCLEPETVRSNRTGSLVNDAVVGCPPGGKGEIETGEVEVQPCHLWGEHAQGFLQQLLPGFVPFQHHDRFGVHGFGH